MNFLALPDARPSCKAWLTADRILFSRTRKHLSFLLTSVENRLLTAVFFFFCCRSPPAASLGSSSRQWRNSPPNVKSTSCYRRTAAARERLSSPPWAAGRESWRRSSTKKLRPATSSRNYLLLHRDLHPTAQPNSISPWQPWLHLCPHLAPLQPERHAACVGN